MKRNVIILSVFVTLALIFGFTGCPGTENVSTCTLTYDANGGTGSVPGGKTVKEDATVIVADRGNLNYPGKTFIGWNTLANGKGTSYAPGDSLTMNFGYTLYAQWIVVQYTVTYHINDGSGTVPGPQSVARDDSLALANGNGFSRDGYFFGGWNTDPSGTETAYESGLSFTPTGDNTNITLYAMWIAPQVRTEDTYKEVTSSGRVRIYLRTDTMYVFSGTEEYRLYRSGSRTGTYSVVATVSPDQLVLEDTTVDWMTVGGAYYYKVAAVSGGTEAMSTNGVAINKVNPRVSMRYTSYSYGYCGVRLVDGDGWYWEWTGTTNSTITSHILLPTPLGNYTLYTKSSSSLPWSNRELLAIKASHNYMISTWSNIVESSFVKSNWTFF